MYERVGSRPATAAALLNHLNMRSSFTFLSAALIGSVTALSIPVRALPGRPEAVFDASATRCSEAKTRVEWTNLPDADRFSFVQAIKCLMDAPAKTSTGNATTRYDELVYAHLSLSPLVHTAGIFLPWHRYFTAGFESMLRSECGYTAPFPWWYELQDAGDFGASSLFTPDYFGSLPESTASEDQPAQSFCITDGVSRSNASCIRYPAIGTDCGRESKVFANRTCLLGFDTPLCLSRGETKAYSAYATQARLDACQTGVTDYLDHSSCVGNGIHVSTHAAIGKVVGNIPASVNDPIFFMHHAFIDWEYMRWQREDDSRWEAGELHILHFHHRLVWLG